MIGKQRSDAKFISIPISERSGGLKDVLSLSNHDFKTYRKGGLPKRFPRKCQEKGERFVFFKAIALSRLALQKRTQPGPSGHSLILVFVFGRISVLFLGVKMTIEIIEDDGTSGEKYLDEESQIRPIFCREDQIPKAKGCPNEIEPKRGFFLGFSF